MNLFPWLLFLHILGAIIAFGPSFSMPIIGAMGAREREHSNFALRVSAQLSKVQIAPLAVFQGITGAGLIIAGNIDLFARGWLLVAIVLYLIAIGYAFMVQTPTARKVIEMTSTPPPPGAGAGGPPPELMRLIKRLQQGGALLMVLIVSIVFLMVVKPF